MKDQQKQYLITGVIVVVVAGAAFYGGVQYQKSQLPVGLPFAGAGMGGQMMSSRPGTVGTCATGQNRQFGTTGTRMGGGAIMGEILSQDDKSITVKDRDGSSKIILLAETTAISTASAVAKTELKVGATVNAFGTSNPDGSITATVIQLNPLQMGRP